MPKSIIPANNEDLISLAAADQYNKELFYKIDLINNAFGTIKQNLQILAADGDNLNDQYIADVKDWGVLLKSFNEEIQQNASRHVPDKPELILPENPQHTNKNWNALKDLEAWNQMHKYRSDVERTKSNFNNSLSDYNTIISKNNALQPFLPITKQTAHRLFNNIYHSLDSDPANEKAATFRSNLEKAAHILELPPLGKDPNRRIGSGRKNDDSMSCAL